MAEETIRLSVIADDTISLGTDSAIKGDKGDPFTYEDFTEEQLEALRGPQGLKGDPGQGLMLLGGYDTEDELLSAHPTGSPGDGYLVGNNLYIWIEDESTWTDVGEIRGPKGDTGEKGEPFTYDDFTKDQLEGLRGPQGIQGDAFTYEDLTEEQIESLRGPQGLQGEPFTYDDFTAEQLEALTGPQGEKGEKGETGTGLNIKGSFDSEETLRETHPSAEPGDAYIIQRDLYVWDETLNDWNNVGQIQGPQGEQGEQGPQGEPFTYDDLTDEQKIALKDAVVADMGGSLEDYATIDYVNTNGGKIDTITVYGGEAIPIVEKNVDLELSNVQIIEWEDRDSSEVTESNDGDKVVYIGPELAEWVYSDTKPGYTADEVGALPNTTEIPTLLSELSGDENHRTVTDAQIQQWSTTSSTLPRLSDEQKAEIKTLMDTYLAEKTLFVYDGSFRRESYAYPNTVDSLSGSISGCVYDGKYILNCGLFAQMIWMGRSIEDFDVENITTSITKAFDWGYYFDFTAAKMAYGITKSDGSYYAGNTYVLESGTTSFVTFDNAAAMAQELYRKGYDIPYGKVEVGDFVFYRSRDISDGATDELEQTSFKYITHVAVVYDVTANGPVVIESTNAFTAAIGRSGLTTTLPTLSRVRGADLENRVVMAARHPYAFGVQCNVPASFEVYRGTEI